MTQATSSNIFKRAEDDLWYFKNFYGELHGPFKTKTKAKSAYHEYTTSNISALGPISDAIKNFRRTK
jgi:hypothetical protein